MEDKKYDKNEDNDEENSLNDDEAFIIDTEDDIDDDNWDTDNETETGNNSESSDSDTIDEADESIITNPGSFKDVTYEDRGSGHIDTALIDRDGDGWHEEKVNVDLEDKNSDGARDTATADLNNDGITEVVGQDTDRDGVMNVATKDSSGFFESSSPLESGESRTTDENLKEVSGENDYDSHSGWDTRTEYVDSDTSVHYSSDGNVTVDVDGEDMEVANLDDVTHRVGTEGDAKYENVGIDHDGYTANVFVETDDDQDSSGDYSAGTGAESSFNTETSTSSDTDVSDPE